ncbi:SUMF1/EgtB/PvdO family nonheme iron enzyme [Candidatus Latescibacterota bacterium]
MSGSTSDTQIAGEDGSYSFTVEQGGTYTVTPTKADYTINPESQIFTNVMSDETANFTASESTLNTYTISGTVTGTDSVQVTMSGDSSDSQEVVADGGTYSFTVNESGNYTITPSKSGFTFTPVNQAFNNVATSQSQNFIATDIPPNTYTISGIVSGADGITITLSGDKSESVAVNDGAAYSFLVNERGNYTVTPTKAGYTFTPASKDFTEVTSTKTQNFSAIENIVPIDITMVSIPGGTFRMGDISGEGESYERPVHTVTISSFEMGIYEVTQSQYESVMGSNPANSYGVGENNPVYFVGWYDMARFCNALSDESALERCYDESTWECDFSKNGYRLPTEAEWEYACRAGTETKYNTGDTESDLDSAGWYKSNSELTSHPVGQKESNAFGLYDMHGNVWEWCNDWYSDNYYSSSPTSNPTGPTSGIDRVARGSNWEGIAEQCRSSYRIRGNPDIPSGALGFRVVRGAFTPGTKPYTISGTVSGADGVTITLSGNASDNLTVDDGDSYSFTVEHGGSYTVTPSNSSYTFLPASQTFNNVTSNQTQDFTASKIVEPTEITMVTIPAVTTPYEMATGYTVTLSAYEMSETEVTNAQYSSYLNAALKSGDIELISGEVYGKSGDWSGQRYLEIGYVLTSNNKCWINYGGGIFSVESGKENWPVIVVSWYGSKSFAAYYGLDLPTEAEWQYAASGGVNYEYGTDDGTISSSNVNYNSNIGYPTDVGSYPPNPFGLFDMSGNVWEWCNDWYGSYPSGNFSNPTGALSGDAPVIRSGSWYHDAINCRSDYRPLTGPGGRGSSTLGFRVVYRDAFTPEPTTYTISGTVSGANGITIALSGDDTDSQVVNDGNSYSFTVDNGGSYTVTPSKSGYTFSPASQTFSSVTSNQTQDFTATEIAVPTEITMVTIPGGTFLMGSPDGFANEQPVHDVTISTFEMSKYEITQGQYESIIGVNPSSFKSGDNYPVEMVSWYDAVIFCNMLSDSDGLERCYDESSWECDFSKNGYRLATEAEWEYACRAETETKYYTGNSDSDVENAGWFSGNSSSKTHPVGQKTANAFGLYDMSGNVFDWCNDLHGSEYYSSSPSNNPTGPTSGTDRVARGGSWYYGVGHCRSAYRDWGSPSSKRNYIGFRVVRGAFTPGTKTYTISGTVTGTDGITITLSGDASDSQVVNDGGSYLFTVAENGNYTLTPSKTGYTFTPLNQTFVNVASNQTQDFKASKITYTISGTVSGTDSVKVTLGGDAFGSLLVDDGGTYSFTAYQGGNYTVIPSKEGYTFNPSSQTFNNISSNQTQNYILDIILEGKIAFTSYRDGHDEIYVMNADGSNQIRLTDTPDASWPSWSPDGTQIAFNSNLNYGSGANHEVFVINADGFNQTRLTDNPANDSMPSWSPDGSKIAFMSSRDDVSGNNKEIYIMDSDGSNQTRLTYILSEINYLSWSPDGSKIAFSFGHFSSQIYVIDVNDSTQVELTNNGSYPSWSPDGSKIAFNVNNSTGNNYDIYIMDADGSNQTRLTDNPAFDIYPSWSPDGSKIAFTSLRNSNIHEIYVMNADGSNQIRLTYGEAYYNSYPSWSPF